MKIANRTTRFLTLVLITGFVLVGGTFTQSAINAVAQDALLLATPTATISAMPTTAPTIASTASAALAPAQTKNDAFRASHQTAHDAIDAAFTHRYVEAGGVNWHYVEAGKADGPTVLLLHGLPESWYSWSKVLPLLDPTFHYIVPDMKGYGRSTSTDQNYNWHHVGDQTLALMDAIGVGKFYIVGHDWGALISSVMVADHPERFLGYVRMEADLKYTPSTSFDKLYAQKPQWKLFQNYNVAVTFLSNAESVIDTVYPTRMVTKLDPVDRDYFVFEFSRPGVAEAVANYFQFANWDLEAAVTKIANNKFSFPVLQLQADSDPSQPKANFTDVETLFPNVQLEWITNASHFDNLDQPGQVADAINHFLQSHLTSLPVVLADDIPAAHTPNGFWKTFPPLILATCSEPLVAGAPDMRGIWAGDTGNGKTHIERIEQCGNRVVITSTGVIHDMRADGTLAHGVNDIAEGTGIPIQVAAEFQHNDTLALRPFGGPVLVTRTLKGDTLMFNYTGQMLQLHRIPELPPAS